MKQQVLSIGKDSIIYGTGSVISRFIGLLLLPVFTAYLTPNEYGVLAMLALLTMVAQPVFSLGLSAAMGPSYYEGNDPRTKATAVWTAFSIHGVTAFLLVVAAWSFPEYLGGLVMLSAEHAHLVALSLTGCALTILATAFRQRVQFERQAQLYVCVTVATAVVAILVSVVTVVYLDLGVLGMVVGQVAGNVVTFVGFLVIGLRSTRPSCSSQMIKELLRLGLPLVPSFGFLFILMHANKYILEWYAGLDAVGRYSIGFNLGATISIVTNGIATAWYPFFMSYIDRQTEGGAIFGRVFTYYVIGVGSLSLVFFAFAKPVVMILTDQAYHDAFIAVGLVTSAYFFMGMYNFFLPGIYFKREISIQSIVQAAAVMVALPLNFVLIKYFGILGTALGVALGHILMAVFTHLWNVYRRDMYPVVEYEWKRVGLFLVIYAATGLVFLGNDSASLSTSILLSLSGGMVVFILVVQLLRPSEIAHIPMLHWLKIKRCVA